MLRAKTIGHGRDVVLGMARCRVPVVAAVNGPAAGLGCSLVALSDVVYMAESAYLCDPHVSVGLVAADGGPLVWPLQTSMLWAKEYAFTGAKIPAARALEMGLANHVVADPVSEALACAKRIAGQPRKAVEATKRIFNIQLEHAVLATLDYATNAEEVTFTSDDFLATIERLNPREEGPARSSHGNPNADEAVEGQFSGRPGTSAPARCDTSSSTRTWTWPGCT